MIGGCVRVFTFYSSNIFDQLIGVTFTASVLVRNAYENNLYYTVCFFYAQVALARSWFRLFIMLNIL